MTPPSQGIFRQEALEYRLRHRGTRSTEVMFPQLMARPVRLALWVALALLALGSIAACLPTIPVTASGLAIVTTETWAGPIVPVLAVLIQDDYHDLLEPGRAADLDFDTQGRDLRGTIIEVEPEPMSPSEASERLGLPHTALSMLNGNVTTAWVAIDGTDPGAFTPVTFGRADIEVGTTRAGSFLPLVGRFFED